MYKCIQYSNRIVLYLRQWKLIIIYEIMLFYADKNKTKDNISELRLLKCRSWKFEWSTHEGGLMCDKVTHCQDLKGARTMSCGSKTEWNIPIYGSVIVENQQNV